MKTTCRCGKRGCNETEISGQALQRRLVERIRGGESSILSPRVLSSDKPLLLREIMDAVAKEDVLCIDTIEKIGVKLGEKTSGLINLLNPELIVVGGELAMTGDYLLNPMRAAVNKHAIHLVSQDTRISRSALGMDAGMVGACLVARSRFIGDQYEYGSTATTKKRPGSFESGRSVLQDNSDYSSVPFSAALIMFSLAEM